MLGLEACTALEELYISHNGITQIEARWCCGAAACISNPAHADRAALSGLGWALPFWSTVPPHSPPGVSLDLVSLAGTLVSDTLEYPGREQQPNQQGRSCHCLSRQT